MGKSSITRIGISCWERTGYSENIGIMASLSLIKPLLSWARAKTDALEAFAAVKACVGQYQQQ